MKLHVEKHFDPEQQWLCSLVTERGRSLLVERGTCKDFDQQGRLVLATEGKLFAAKPGKGEVALEQLADFNGAKPMPLKPPAWATRW
jgi:hypothetical protein